MLPQGALVLLPTLVTIQMALWADAPTPHLIAGQIEKESCVTLQSAGCWNPNVQLKTSREWGRGIFMVTSAYAADGSLRFNKQEELRVQYKELAGWTTARWADPQYQLTAGVLMDKGIFTRVTTPATVADQWRMTLAAYNGGESGLRQDRLLCKNTKGCDPSIWYGNVELTSTKSRVKWQGYGQSAYAINRNYVSDIEARSDKYQTYFVSGQGTHVEPR